MTLTGSAAVVRWGYAPAATVGPWTITAIPDGGSLTATVVSADTFAVSQRPLVFVVTRSSGQGSKWPITTLQIEGPSLTATLGPPEGASHGQVRHSHSDSDSNFTRGLD